MAKTTLAELKEQVLDRADMTGSGFITDTRVRDYVNSAGAELHQILVDSFENYFLKIDTFSLATDQEKYLLPNDYLKTKKLFIKEGDVRVVISSFNLDEFDRSEHYAVPLTYGDSRYLRYRIEGSFLYFTPTPRQGDSIEHWYTPQYKKLINDGDELNYSVPVGWDEYIIVTAAMKCLVKEESDTAPLAIEKQQLEQRIINAAANRDEGEPHRIRDVTLRYKPWWVTYV